MNSPIYTVGVWVVEPGSEADFILAWKELAAIFLHLPKPPHANQAKLIQSVTNPSLFYSLGPWNNFSDIRAMRDTPAVQACIAKLQQLCTRDRVGNYEVVAQA